MEQKSTIEALISIAQKAAIKKIEQGPEGRTPTPGQAPGICTNQ